LEAIVKVRSSLRNRMDVGLLRRRNLKRVEG
jgi:hypothetical protein